MHDGEICETCRFWNPAWRFKRQAEASLSDATGSVAKRTDRGQCRRYAPRASALTTAWMETRSWDWCGDYQPRTADGRHAATEAVGNPQIEDGGEG